MVDKLIFKSKNSNDVGTMHTAKVFLKSKNAPLEPMANVDAFTDLLNQYTSALLICCYRSLDTEEAQTGQFLDDETLNAKLDKIVDMLVQGEGETQDYRHTCKQKDCNKKFVKVRFIGSIQTLTKLLTLFKPAL